MNKPIRIKSVATASPEHSIKQKDIKQFASDLFQRSFRDLERLLPVFENTRITQRSISQPLEWFAKEHNFEDSNEIYRKTALDLAEKAARKAMERGNLRPEDIEMVVFVSTTGISTPSLDAALIQRLGLPSSTARLPVWGLGCAGGVSGLATAARLQGSLKKNLLFVAVELCSLTFQKNDLSKSNLIATSLFADGAAAVIIGHDGDGPEILASHSTLFNDSDDIMGWDVVSGGLKVRFSRDIPALVRDSVPELLDRACAEWKIEKNALKQFVLHPGGAKVLAAYEQAMSISSEDLRHAYDCLSEHGNLSSASVLFVLDRHMTEEKSNGTLGLMAALGPGFSAELLLFRW